MSISTFDIKICGQKLCAQKDGFRKSGHILCFQLHRNVFEHRNGFNKWSTKFLQ